MNRRVGRSLRMRLALFASITMLLLSIVVNSIVLYALHNQAIYIRSHEAFGKVVPVLLMIRRDRLTRVLDDHDLDGIQVVDPAGRVAASTRNLAGLPRLTTAIPFPGRADGVAELCDLPGLPGRCYVVIAMTAYQPDGKWLIYALAPDLPWYISPDVLGFQVFVTAALIVLAWFGVSHVVAHTLAPVTSITRHLAEITADGGGIRLPVPENLDDEIKTLAETANQTLERLEAAMAKQEAAMEQQRRFAGDASHDLRSPITAMRTQVEEAMLHPEQADWPATAAALMASLDRLQAIVTDLLTLTKLDTGAPSHDEPVNLGDLVAAESRRPGPKRIVTRVQRDVVVTGDRLRLARLVTNLLDNAERHAESQITVTVRQQGGQAVLEVLDDGTGIEPDQRERVFQRFARLDASRNIDAGGTGLGLTIARQIAESYGGTLTIEDSDRGALFVLRIPLLER